MKYLKFISLLAFVAMGFSSPPSGITDSERKFVVDYMVETRDALMKTVKGLSNEQLNFKSSPESWSVAECVEHIALTETGLFSWMESSLKEPGDPAKLAEAKMTSEAIVNMITDRSNKFTTNEGGTPKNSFGSCEAALKEFNTRRDAHIEYMKKTQEDLHGHSVSLPNGLVFDSYQVVVFMAGHTKRHTLQIEEVMADANFPKKKK